MSALTATEICAEAAKLVGGDRSVSHGDKTVNFQNTADAWNALLRAKVRQSMTQSPAGYDEKAKQHMALVPTLTALDVANMLEAFKIARRYSGTHNIDDYVDGAGYAGCGGEIADAMASSQGGAAS